MAVIRCVKICTMHKNRRLETFCTCARKYLRIQAGSPSCLSFLVSLASFKSEPEGGMAGEWAGFLWFSAAVTPVRGGLPYKEVSWLSITTKCYAPRPFPELKRLTES